jgi:type II secretion system protein G
MRHHGFTLIELLIVVAIIALLAAIAVPNFLEAQTRAKVSRIKSDMRSVATALEAYRVDANFYPPDNLIPDGPMAFGVSWFLRRLEPLTTPIAYVTSLPIDLFASNVAHSESFISLFYRAEGMVGGAVLSPVVFEYARFDADPQGAGMSPGYDDPELWARFCSNPETAQWALNATGPNVSEHVLIGDLQFAVYDPTNGTISRGQIVRTNVSGADVPRLAAP